MSKNFVFRGGTLTVTPNRDKSGYAIALPDGETIEIKPQSSSFGTQKLETVINDRSIEISHLGVRYLFRVAEPSKAILEATRKGASATEGVICAPMTGILSALNVNCGDHVNAYDPVATVEAMKVMATLEAPFSGIVKKIFRTSGSSLEHGEAILEIYPSETPAG